MGHDDRDTMKHDRFLHTMRYSYFQNIENFTNRRSPHYDRMWKIRRVYNYLNNKYYILYNPMQEDALSPLLSTSL
jgi:hypothetical protein